MSWKRLYYTSAFFLCKSTLYLADSLKVAVNRHFLLPRLFKHCLQYVFVCLSSGPIYPCPCWTLTRIPTMCFLCSLLKWSDLLFLWYMSPCIRCYIFLQYTFHISWSSAAAEVIQSLILSHFSSMLFSSFKVSSAENMFISSRLKTFFIFGCLRLFTANFLRPCTFLIAFN